MKEEIRQFYVLLKHFVLRLFNNDLLTYENERRERVIVILVMLAVAGGFIARKFLSPYLYPTFSGVSIHNIWREKAAFLTLTMAMTGIFSVINWENIFLDKKDYSNLRVLPVKTGTLLMAKFFSLLIYVALLSLAFNLFAGLVFTFFLADMVKVNIIYFGLTHYITNFLANLFVFLGVACIQGIFTILFRNRLLKKISNLFQVLMLVGFISVFVWFPRVYVQLPYLKLKSSSFMYYFPPLWFTGMYEKMLGNKEFIFTSHFYIALLALVVPAVFYLLSSPITFKRLLNDSQGNGKTSQFFKIFAFVKQGFNAIFLGNPIQRGMFYFILHTLKRNRFHKLQMAMYMAIPVSYILTRLIFTYSKTGASSFQIPGAFLISIPLLLYFFLVVGIRMVVRHPIMLNANWVFQITEDADKKHYIKGLKKALFFSAGLPLLILLFTFYLYCWGWQLATYHSLYTAAIYFLLTEVFFCTYKKIPFAGAYDPGKPNLKLYGVLYLAGFIQYIVTFSNLGLIFLSKPENYIIFFAVILGFKMLLVWKRYEMYKKDDFRFVYDEEEPRPLMLTFDI